jgi:hypothetical protein
LRLFARTPNLIRVLSEQRVLAMLLAGTVAAVLGWNLPRYAPVLVAGSVLVALFGVLDWFRPWWATWLYVGTLVLVPGYVGVSLGSFGDWTPAHVLGLISLAVLVARRGIHPTRWTVLDCSVFGYLLATAVPFVFKGLAPTWVFKYMLFTVIQYGAPYVILRSISTDRRAIERLIQVIVFWASVVSVFAVAETISGLNPFTHLEPAIFSNEIWSDPVFRGDAHRATVSFSHPIALGMFAALVLPLGVWLAQRWRGRRSWIMWSGTISVASTLLLTLSRGPWLGALVAFVIPATLQPTGKRRAAGFVVVLVLACGALYASGLTPITQLIDDSFDPTSAAYANIVYRQNLPSLVLDAWQRSMLIGYSDYNANGAFPAGISIDNFYLASLILTGVLGLGGFVVVAAAALQRLWKIARDPCIADSTTTSLAAALLGVFAGQLLILATVAMIGSGAQVFWGFLGVAAGFWGHAEARTTANAAAAPEPVHPALVRCSNRPLTAP